MLATTAPTVEVGARPDLTAVFAEHGPRLRGLIRNTTHETGVIDDILQETFLRAHRAIDRFDTSMPVWPWLSTIAKRLCFDHLRSRARTNMVIDLTGGQTWDWPDPDDATARADDAAVVSDVLRQVSSRQRRLLALHYLAGWPYQDIADSEDMSLDAVKASLKRARRTVRERYEP